MINGEWVISGNWETSKKVSPIPFVYVINYWRGRHSTVLYLCMPLSSLCIYVSMCMYACMLFCILPFLAPSSPLRQRGFTLHSGKSTIWTNKENKRAQINAMRFFYSDQTDSHKTISGSQTMGNSLLTRGNFKVTHSPVTGHLKASLHTH